MSCGRDGQIRLAELSSTGVCRATRRLGQHRGPTHKLAVHQETPHVLLSSGEDGLIMNIDVRENKPEKCVYLTSFIYCNYLCCIFILIFSTNFPTLKR